MYPLVYKYLVVNKMVSVPGIGLFSIVTKPSVLDQVNNVLQPSASFIKFSNETALADKNFFKFVAKEMGINEVEAIKGFHDFAYQLKSNIAHSDGVLLPGIGKLKKAINDQFAFEQEDKKMPLFQALTVPDLQNVSIDNTNEYDTKPEQIIAAELKPTGPSVNLLAEELIYINEEELPKPDRWPIYAAILGTIGIIAIVYYYMQNQ